MKYVRMVNGLPVEVSSEFPKNATWDKVNGWMSLRQDVSSMEEAEKLAVYITAMTGNVWLSADNSSSVSPRFEVFEAPTVGDDVSRGFNGDYYPCGKIVRITKSWRITTSTGARFNRCKNRPAWKEIGGTFSLVSGTVDERNPHF